MRVDAFLSILREELPIFPQYSGEIIALAETLEEVLPGSAFVAVPGTRVDGHSFLNAAKSAGADLLLGERDPKEFGFTREEYLQVPDARLALGLLASSIVGNPSRSMQIIGVTGTSGKTTTSYLIESILRHSGKKTGLIGTVSFRIDGHEIPSTHTTPGPVELQKLLQEMKNSGCEAVVLEVSSHALKQHRGAGIAFDGMVFTNLSPEHLDYHPDLEDYYLAKRRLFLEQAVRSRRWGKSPRLVVHSGTIAGDRLLAEVPESSPFWVPETTMIDAKGIQGVFSGIAIQSPLIGRFNAENIAAAVAITQAIGISEPAIIQGIQNLVRVPGRLERIPDPVQGRIILVDYAHKPDALEKVLEALRPMRTPGKKLITVFGCGGDRDRTKRPVMGEIACRLSDHVILTSDNPRSENPEQILDEIERGCGSAENRERESDRRNAIRLAIQKAKPGDLVLIAGKGHETTQTIGKEKTPFDDREECVKALNLIDFN